MSESVHIKPAVGPCEIHEWPTPGRPLRAHVTRADGSRAVVDLAGPAQEQSDATQPRLLTLVDRPPIGETTGIGCGPGGCRPVTLPTYTHTAQGERLRRARRASKLTLLDVGRKFGIGSEDASGLERGAKDLSQAEWDTVIGWCEAQGLADKPAPAPITVFTRGSPRREHLEPPVPRGREVPTPPVLQRLPKAPPRRKP